MLEGGTLRDRLVNGPLPPRKAIEYAALVARALGTAQEKGITHRDVKPENIFISRDGQVKILDFGLARLSARESDDVNATISISPQTAAGAVLGTASYMSPEQARGLPADARSDIFSLGSVLYEVLSARRPFTGASFADLVTSILKEDPAPLPPPAKEIPGLERVVRRCLEKNPSERFQSARDLAFQLDSMISTLDMGSSSALPIRLDDSTPSRSRALSIRWVAAVAAIFAVGASAWWLRETTMKRDSNSPVQFERLTDFYGLEENPALAPDGKSVAFVSDSTGTRQIWIRLLAGGRRTFIARRVSWSGDNKNIYAEIGEGESDIVLFDNLFHQ